MPSIREIRQQNLAALVKEAGGQQAVADKIGRDKNQVYQWLLPEGAEGARNMGHRSARLLESAFGKPVGWMDTDPGATSQPVSIDRKTLANALRIAAAYVEIMGLPPEKALDAEVLANAYEVAAADRAGDESLLGSTTRLAALFRGQEGETNDERGKGEATGDPHGKGRKARTGRAAS